MSPRSPAAAVPVTDAPRARPRGSVATGVLAPGRWSLRAVPGPVGETTWGHLVSRSPGLSEDAPALVPGRNSLFFVAGQVRPMCHQEYRSLRVRFFAGARSWCGAMGDRVRPGRPGAWAVRRAGVVRCASHRPWPQNRHGMSSHACTIGTMATRCRQSQIPDMPDTHTLLRVLFTVGHTAHRTAYRQHAGPSSWPGPATGLLPVPRPENMDILTSKRSVAVRFVHRVQPRRPEVRGQSRPTP